MSGDLHDPVKQGRANVCFCGALISDTTVHTTAPPRTEAVEELTWAFFDSPVGHGLGIRMELCRQLADIAVERLARLCPKCGSDQKPEENDRE